MKKVFDFILFLRPFNLVMVFAIFWIFEYFIFEPLFASHGFGLSLKSFQLDLIAFNTVLVAMTGYLINDWYDQSIDRLNKPYRFLVKYSVSSARFFGLIWLPILFVIVIAVFLAFSLRSFHWVWIYPFFTFIMWCYASSLKLKGLVGNIVVSFSIAAIPWLILLAEKTGFILLKNLDQDAASQLVLHLSIFSLLIFLSNMARELVKDIEDAKGDKSQNSGSFFLKKGLKKTKRLVLVSVLLVLGLEIALIMKSIWITNQFIYLSFGVLVVSVFLAFKVLKSSEKAHFSSLSFVLKILMLIGLIQVLCLGPR
jgi:4-hydroxybenzoate polyprenyltransferase